MMPSVIPLKLPNVIFKIITRKEMKSSHQASSAVSQKAVPCPLTSAPLKAARKSDIQIDSASPSNTEGMKTDNTGRAVSIRPHAPVASDETAVYFTL